MIYKQVFLRRFFMNVIQALTELYNSEPSESVYKELARRILTNLDDMKKVTIYDVAELTDSSRTTVWRLVQKLGYESFSDFRHSLQTAASSYVYYNRMVKRKKTTEASTLIHEIGANIEKSLSLYTDSINEELLEELVDELYSASHVHFYFPLRLSSIYSLQQNLWKTGKDSDYDCLVPEMLNSIDSLDKNSIVFINTIEFTETIDMTNVFEKLATKKCKVWHTGNAESQFLKYATRQLMCSESGPTEWMIAVECFILTISEYYRAKYIDKK